jgi:hypothetical protein
MYGIDTLGPNGETLKIKLYAVLGYQIQKLSVLGRRDLQLSGFLIAELAVRDFAYLYLSKKLFNIKKIAKCMSSITDLPGSLKRFKFFKCIK